MSPWRDLDYEVQRLPLDVDTADRLLAGRILPADAPPGYEPVAALLNGLRHEEERVFRHEDTASEPVNHGRSPHLATTATPRRSTLHRFKLAGAAFAGALVCTTGLAFAGTLPGAAQDVASSMLSKVGVTVPGPSENAGTHPSVRGNSSTDASVSDDAEANENGAGKGVEVSELATTTELTGVDKGAAISTLASDGKSQAGQHGEAAADHGAAASGANDGAATANEASGGHSSAGADNAASGQSHRP